MKQMTKLEMGEELSIDQEDLATQLPAPRDVVLLMGEVNINK